MPRFHFNVHDGFTRPDAKGRELPDLKAARREAIRLCAAILEDDADRVALGELWYMEVNDHLGQVLFQFDFRVRESASEQVQISPYDGAAAILVAAGMRTMVVAGRLSLQDGRTAGAVITTCAMIQTPAAACTANVQP